MKRWSVVKVFISSTFRDMHAERHALVREVFPALRERCKERRVYVEDVDLRWGVLEDQNPTNVCLNEIDRCRPFFLCLLGERYGWIPPEHTISITHKEIEYGALEPLAKSKEVLAFFYFRSPKSTYQIPEPQQGDFMEPQGSESAEKLADLKKAIIQSGLPVREYSGRWVSDRYPLGFQEKPGYFEGLEEFSEKVLEDLWSAYR